MKRLLLSGLCTLPYLCFGGSAYAEFTSSEFQRITLPFNSLQAADVLFLSPQKFSQHNFTKVAQVCWILDTGECFGNDFGWNDETPGSPSGPTDNFTPQDYTDCIKEGYTLTSCPEGKVPNKFCMYDNNYFAECIDACPADFKECKDPYYGVGEECDGKYKECQCDYCEGYDYAAEDIPAGYIADGEPCNSCNGPRYKIKINPCDGYMECEREPAPDATTCQSGDKILYSDCDDCDPNCPEGTTESNPGGCGGSTKNECGDKTCYYPYEACCSDECPNFRESSPSACTYGATSCYDSCYGNTWYKCNSAPSDPCAGVSCPTSVSCSYGCASYSTATSCCSSVCTSCKSDPCEGKTGVTCGSNETCASYDSCGNCERCETTCVSGGSSSCTGQTSPCNSTTQTQISSCKDCSGVTHYTCKTKNCTANFCYDYTMTSCPPHGHCSTCTPLYPDCSTGPTRIKLDSCDSGYDMSGNNCIKISCSSQFGSDFTDGSCPSGTYKDYNSCGTLRGTSTTCCRCTPYNYCPSGYSTTRPSCSTGWYACTAPGRPDCYAPSCARSCSYN